MTSNARPSRQSGKFAQLRKGVSLEIVRLACPDSAQASVISESFGLPVIDSIRDLHHKTIVDTAESLNQGLGDRAMQIHLQRIVGSAHGAGQFYSRAVSEARDATANSANDARDEDLDCPVGSDSNARRKRKFAAEGVVTAYEEVVGEAWKPFQRQAENPGQTVDRKAAEMQMAALY